LSPTRAMRGDPELAQPYRLPGRQRVPETVTASLDARRQAPSPGIQRRADGLLEKR
jgi:hypothetical protein